MRVSRFFVPRPKKLSKNDKYYLFLGIFTIFVPITDYESGHAEQKIGSLTTSGLPRHLRITRVAGIAGNAISDITRGPAEDPDQTSSRKADIHHLIPPSIMGIITNIDVMMAKRKMSLGELAERVGITPANLSILKNGKARAIRFSTLEALCRELDCQPGDIIEYRPEKPENR